MKEKRIKKNGLIRCLFRTVLSCLLTGSLILCVACQGEQKKKDVKPPSKGMPYEMLLVVDQPVWESSLQDTLKQIFQGSVPGLPQHEPMFRMLKLFPQNYVQMYRTMRLTVFVSLDKSVEKPFLGVAYHVTAQPQVTLTVKAADPEGLARILSSRKEEIVDYLVEMELQQEEERLRKKYHVATDKAVRQIFGYQACVPAEMRSMKRRDQFLWVTTDLPEKDLNFVMYTCPLPGRDQIPLDYWIAQRDSALKQNIPGSQPDQWMTTARLDDKPVVTMRCRKLEGQSVWEIRGLWEMRHGGIGGPFVSLARLDSAAGKAVVCEGFVYSPRTDKRDLLRRMEAALRTVGKIEP